MNYRNTKYILRVTRPLIDDQTLDLEFDSREECSVGLVVIIRLESATNNEFKVIKQQVSDDEEASILTVTTSTGTFTCFPKPPVVN